MLMPPPIFSFRFDDFRRHLMTNNALISFIFHADFSDTTPLLIYAAARARHTLPRAIRARHYVYAPRLCLCHHIVYDD